ncbi:MAG: 4Fe-4S ferredoxin [Chloroflexi bacterium]|nr:4Fe-4S ferredoxin [Chloroflexota bacterium]
MAIVSIDVRLCLPGCNLCIENCPMDVFKRDETTGKMVVVYEQDCCGLEPCAVLCESRCPRQAIQVSRPIRREEASPISGTGQAK